MSEIKRGVAIANAAVRFRAFAFFKALAIGIMRLRVADVKGGAGVTVKQISLCQFKTEFTFLSPNVQSRAHNNVNIRTICMLPSYHGTSATD